MDLAAIAGTSFRAVLTIFFVILMGVLAAYYKVLTRQGTRVLSLCLNYIFVPALLFHSLAAGLSIEKIINLWSLAVLGIMFVILNGILAFPISYIAKPEPWFRKWFILSITFPNVVAFPLILVASVCDQVAFDKLDSSFNPIPIMYENGTIYAYEKYSLSECALEGNLYVFIYTAFNAITFWGFGYSYTKNDPLPEDLEKTSKKKPMNVEFNITKELINEDSTVSTTEIIKSKELSNEKSLEELLKEDEQELIAENLLIENENKSTTQVDQPLINDEHGKNENTSLEDSKAIIGGSNDTILDHDVEEGKNNVIKSDLQPAAPSINIQGVENTYTAEDAIPVREFLLMDFGSIIDSPHIKDPKFYGEDDNFISSYNSSNTNNSSSTAVNRKKRLGRKRSSYLKQGKRYLADVNGSFMFTNAAIEKKRMQKAGLNIGKNKTNERDKNCKYYLGRVWAGIKELASIPPLTAQMIGLICGLIEPIQQILYSPDSYLRPITTAIQIVSGGAVPLINISMAASLGNKIFATKDLKHLFGGAEGDEKRSTILALVLAKMIIVPAIEYCIVTALIPYLPQNKLFLMVLYIEVITPTANMTVVMATIVNQMKAAETVAVAILGMFIVSIPTMLGFLSLAIYLGEQANINYDY